MSIVHDYFEGLHSCLEELSARDIEEVAEIIFSAYKKGRQVFILGNGGSASTASHFARDLKIGTAVKGKPRVRAVSLADSVVAITSLANDVDYASIFEEQLISHLDGGGDVVIGISASGSSPNVLKAIDYARKNGAVTIGFAGFGGGKLKELAHKCIVLSSRNYGQVEDVHLTLDHVISCLVKEKIANGK